jgi:hypothetical protein
MNGLPSSLDICYVMNTVLVSAFYKDLINKRRTINNRKILI